MLLHSSEAQITWMCWLTLQQFHQLKILTVLFFGSNTVCLFEVKTILWLWFAVDDSLVTSEECMCKCVLCCDLIWHVMCPSGTCWMEKSGAVRDELILFFHILLPWENILCFFSSTAFLSFHHFTNWRRLAGTWKMSFQYLCFLNTWVFIVYFFAGTRPVHLEFGYFFTILKIQFLWLTRTELWGETLILAYNS